MSYEAREFGVSRSIRPREAKTKCPGIQLAYVPERRGKADLTCYRQAGAEVIQILAEFTSIIERASIDEAYLDVTELVSKRIEAADLESSTITAESVPNTHVPGFKKENSEEGGGFEEWVREEGCGQELVLTVGAMIANDIRKAVFERTGFTCSAGIGYNKVRINVDTVSPPIFPLSPLSSPLSPSLSLFFPTVPHSLPFFPTIPHYHQISPNIHSFDGIFDIKTLLFMFCADGCQDVCRDEQAQRSDHPTSVSTTHRLHDNTHRQNVSQCKIR